MRKIVKSRRFLQKIAKGPMIQGWENWVLLMCVEGAWWEPGRELQEKLEEKCGRYALKAAYTLVASSVGPHTLVASGVGPHTLVA